MKFIIVDDSEYKVNSMKDSIKELFVNAEIISFNYGNAALKHLINEETFEEPTYLILDMNFPSISDSRIKADNGLMFMHKLSRREIDKKIQTIIFSSDKVDLERFTEFDNVLGSIRHDSSVSIDYDLIYIVGKYGKSLNPEDLTEYGSNMFFDTVINSISRSFCGIRTASLSQASIIGTVF